MSTENLNLESDGSIPGGPLVTTELSRPEVNPNSLQSTSDLLEYQRFVRHAPSFSEQLTDEGRLNEITCVPGIRTTVEESAKGHVAVEVTEHEALEELNAFLDQVLIRGNEQHRQQAASMKANLSFIGQKEYQEAITGIGNYWRTILEGDDSAQICAVTGRIRENKIKSDSYMLDNILRGFSDEELGKYRGRIVTDPRGLTCSPKDARIVILDDWPISGSQLRFAAQSLSLDFPELRNSIEAQVIAATREKIDEGLKLIPVAGEDVPHTAPVRSYFAAEPVSRDIAPKSAAHITSFYCSVDYGFNQDIADMANDIGIDMPIGATNIVRPYWGDISLNQVARLGEPGYEPIPPKFTKVMDEDDLVA